MLLLKKKQTTRNCQPTPLHRLLQADTIVSNYNIVVGILYGLRKKTLLILD